MKVEDLKPGDTAYRTFGTGMKAMTMRVRTNDGTIITADAVEDDGKVFPGGWEFDAKTGAEIDEDLHWGPKYGRTGSYLGTEKWA